MVAELQGYGSAVDIYDPWANPEDVQHEYGLSITNELPAAGQYDAIVIAVSHREFFAMTSAEIRALGKDTHVLYDIKNVLPVTEVDGRL